MVDLVKLAKKEKGIGRLDMDQMSIGTTEKPQSTPKTEYVK